MHNLLCHRHRHRHRHGHRRRHTKHARIPQLDSRAWAPQQSFGHLICRASIHVHVIYCMQNVARLPHTIMWSPKRAFPSMPPAHVCTNVAFMTWVWVGVEDGVQCVSCGLAEACKCPHATLLHSQAALGSSPSARDTARSSSPPPRIALHYGGLPACSGLPAPHRSVLFPRAQGRGQGGHRPGSCATAPHCCLAPSCARRAPRTYRSEKKASAQSPRPRSRRTAPGLLMPRRLSRGPFSWCAGHRAAQPCGSHAGQLLRRQLHGVGAVRRLRAL